MIYLQWVIAIAGAVSAIIGIWKIVVKLVHLSDMIKEMQEHEQENYLSLLRLTVMSEEMPLGERIVAGDKYIKAGGNGEVKHYIEEHLHTKERV